MAVNATTVEVVMPAMGDSVTEGTVLEWHKAEGDSIAADETLVEISTDKVDAEVPAPIAGRVVKVHAAEGDTVEVGAVLAEIAARRRGSAAPTSRRGARSRRGSAWRPPRRRREAPRETVDIVMPPMGESVSEGVVLEWAKQPGDEVEADETVVEISTDKVDAEVPAPASGTLAEILAQAGDTVSVGQVLGRLAASNGAAAGNGARARADRRAATRRRARRRRRSEDGVRATPVARRVAAAHGIDLATVQGTGPAGRIGKDDVLAAADGPTARGATAPRPPPTGRTEAPPPATARPPSSRAPRRCSRATWTSRAPSRPRPRSARWPSPRSTPAASSSRRPAGGSPSRTSSPTPSPARPRSRCR